MLEPFQPITGAVLYLADIQRIVNALAGRDEAACKEALDLLAERSNAGADQATCEKISAYQAGQPPYLKEGEVEIDQRPAVSIGDGDGAYVQGWVWVSNDCAGLPSNDEE